MPRTARQRVLIDVTAAHFWDISGVGALDKIVARLRRDGRDGRSGRLQPSQRRHRRSLRAARQNRRGDWGSLRIDRGLKTRACLTP